MWRDSFIYSFNYLPLAAGVANALAAVSVFTNNIVRIHAFSDFEALKLSYTFTDSRVYVKISDGATGRYFTQTPGMDMRAFAGSLVALGPGANALVFRNIAKPFTVAGGSPMNVEAADFSGAPNTVRISFHGVKIRPGNPPWAVLKRNYDAKRDIYFAYPVEVALGANTTQQVVIASDIDADWYIQRVLCQRTAAATIELNTGASDSDWQSVAIHIDNFTGNSQGYNILPEPKFIQANAVLNILLADLSGAPNTIKLTFEGVKRYF